MRNQQDVLNMFLTVFQKYYKENLIRGLVSIFYFQIKKSVNKSVNY